jgi:hypothetical protein
MPLLQRIATLKTKSNSSSSAKNGRKDRRRWRLRNRRRKVVNNRVQQYVGMHVDSRVRNSVGSRVDYQLAHVLALQSLPVKELIVGEKQLLKTDNRRNLLCHAEDLRFRKEGRGNLLWQSMLLPASLRRVGCGRCAPSRFTTLRDERFARLWLSGLIAFRKVDFYDCSLRRYVGRVSNFAYSFSRAPSRVILRKFIAACVKGLVRYSNVFGPASNELLKGSALFQRCCSGEMPQLLSAGSNE